QCRYTGISLCLVEPVRNGPARLPCSRISDLHALKHYGVGRAMVRKDNVPMRVLRLTLNADTHVQAARRVQTACPARLTHSAGTLSVSASCACASSAVVSDGTVAVPVMVGAMAPKIDCCALSRISICSRSPLRR